MPLSSTHPVHLPERVSDVGTIRTPDLPYRAEPKVAGIELQSSAASDSKNEASLLGGDGGAGVGGDYRLKQPVSGGRTMDI